MKSTDCKVQNAKLKKCSQIDSWNNPSLGFHFELCILHSVICNKCVKSIFNLVNKGDFHGFI